MGSFLGRIMFFSGYKNVKEKKLCKVDCMWKNFELLVMI